MKNYSPIAEGTAIPKIKSKLAAYQFRETRELVQLVEDASELIQARGEEAFNEFRRSGSRWRNDESYIFVLDTAGNMLVHIEAELEGKNQIELKDISGKPIIRGLIDAAMMFTGKPEGWYHYQWPVPGGLFPRWKSSFVKLVTAVTGKQFIVGSGMYNDRMEKEFVVDMVDAAVYQVKKNREAAFRLFHDPTGPFITKEAYIFVVDNNGVDLVNPAFPNLEGRNILDVKDIFGKELIREMLEMAQTNGSGWVNYMWPKPGENIPTQKSAYVTKVQLDGNWIIMGCGVYLADAPKMDKGLSKMSASQLMDFVRGAAALLEKQGEAAYPAFREKGSKWLRDNTYVFVWTMDGVRAFHGAEPEKEGADLSESKDIHGRPIGKTILEAGRSDAGEGWVHYLYPEPGNIFPTWKSSFVKRVKFPSGKQFIVGCGIYNMEMNKVFIEDLVNRATELVTKQGKDAFGLFRDKNGPFFFMDTYVFVQTPDGIELVNPAIPSLEGRNLMELKDLHGKTVIKEEIAAAMTNGSAWVEHYWYRPGDNKPALKNTFVRKTQFGGQTFIVGSGFYTKEKAISKREIQRLSWQAIAAEKLSDKLSRQVVFGENGTMCRFIAKEGGGALTHSHINEEYLWVISGSLKFTFENKELVVGEDEVLVIPPGEPHSIVALKDSRFIEFFTPAREDWLRGEDKYYIK
jgi:signal transduction histidine kinase